MRLIKVKRPSDQQEEGRFLYGTQHQCDASWTNRRHGITDSDVLLFPVGLFGMGMPNGAAFEVMATEPCEACGVLLRCMFAWNGPTIIDLGAK